MLLLVRCSSFDDAGGGSALDAGVEERDAREREADVVVDAASDADAESPELLSDPDFESPNCADWNTRASGGGTVTAVSSNDAHSGMASCLVCTTGGAAVIVQQPLLSPPKTTGKYRLMIDYKLPADAGASTGGAIVMQYAQGATASAVISARRSLRPRAGPSTTTLTSYTRPVGTPLVCPSGKGQSGALCYDACPSGYKLVAGVCWQECPAGYNDAGAVCGKPSSYGRGAGYPWKLGDKVGSLDEARERCVKDNPQGCEKNGQIIYPKCKASFHEVGSNVCSPDCPAGMTDTGALCNKKTLTRGATPLSDCPSGKVKENQLCYEPCKAGYAGVSTTCKPM